MAGVGYQPWSTKDACLPSVPLKSHQPLGLHTQAQLAADSLPQAQLATE